MERQITLRDVRKHSSLMRKIRVYDSFDLILRPWVPEQLEIAMPIAVKLIELIKEHNLTDLRGKTIEQLMSILLPLLKNSKEYIEDLMNLIYVSIELTNENIEIDFEGKKETIPLFSKEEMQKQIELPILVKILSILLELNFTENPFLNLPGQSMNQKEQEIQQVIQQGKN